MDWPGDNPAMPLNGLDYGRPFGLREGKVASERLAL
jgi:hypothetical protein